MEKLADIFEAPISGEWGTELDDSCTGIPVLRTTNFTNDGIISFDNIVYRNINLERKQNKILRRGDIVIEKSGGSPSQPVGRVVYFDLDSEEPFVCNNFTAILRLKKNYNPSYIFYLMHFLYATQRTLNFQNKTTGIANLKLKDYLEQTSVNIPSIEKQNRCVAVLEYCQQTIARYINLQEKLDTLVKSRFIEMFGDPVTNPMGWDLLLWQDVFETTTGKLDSNAAVDSGPYPFFTCAKEPFTIDTYAFDCEALLLAGNNAAGVYDVKHYKGKFNAYQRTYVLQLKSSNWSYELFKHQLEGRLKFLQSQSIGTNTKYLTLGILHRLNFIVPPIALQNQFAAFVAQVDKSKSVLQKLLEKQELLRAALMQEYFG